MGALSARAEYVRALLRLDVNKIPSNSANVVRENCSSVFMTVSVHQATAWCGPHRKGIETVTLGGR